MNTILDNVIKSVSDLNFEPDSWNDYKNLVENGTIKDIFDDPKFIELSKKYIDERDKKNPSIDDIDTIAINRLRILKLPHVEKIELMSSYPYFNILGVSDVDFGLLVHNLDEKKFNDIKLVLEKEDWECVRIRQISKDNCIWCFGKTFDTSSDDLEIELKVRDLDLSDYVTAVHDILNKLPCTLQQKWTYLKYLVRKNANYDVYHKLKHVLYNYYLYVGDVKNRQILI